MATLLLVLPTQDLTQYFNPVADHKTFVCAMNTVLGLALHGKPTTDIKSLLQHSYGLDAYVDMIDNRTLPALFDGEGQMIPLNRPVFEAFREIYDALVTLYHAQLIVMRRHIEQTMAIRSWQFIKHIHHGMLLAVETTHLLTGPGYAHEPMRQY